MSGKRALFVGLLSFAIGIVFGKLLTSLGVIAALVGVLLGIAALVAQAFWRRRRNERLTGSPKIYADTDL